MRRIVSFGPAFVVLVATVVGLLAAPAMLQRVSVVQTSGEIRLARQTLGDDDILERIDRAVSAVASAMEPSVVHIDTMPDPDSGSRRGASGSGWVYDRDGHIVTNAHVIRGSRSIGVEFSDGRVSSGTLVGMDPYTDIAVVRVRNGGMLFPAERATGRLPRMGERVFAFGSPFGFKFSMSEGIVSGLGRAPGVPGALTGRFTNYIQTDAAVNPGNSGGPLVDIRGHVVGMNVAIATSGSNSATNEGDSAGISFAIPMGTIEPIVEQLIRTGRVSRGFMGISFLSETERVESPDGGTMTGVRVRDVTDDGPSLRAGIRAGDVITSVRGYPVVGAEALRVLVSSASPGEQIEVEVWREGDLRVIEVTLDPMPGEQRAQLIGASLLLQLGVGVADTRRGPVLRTVLPETPAYRSGLRGGQRVVRVEGERVSSARDVLIALDDAGLFSGRVVEVEVADEEDAGEVTRQSVRLRLDR